MSDSDQKPRKLDVGQLNAAKRRAQERAAAAWTAAWNWAFPEIKPIAGRRSVLAGLGAASIVSAINPTGAAGVLTASGSEWMVSEALWSAAHAELAAFNLAQKAAESYIYRYGTSQGAASAWTQATSTIRQTLANTLGIDINTGIPTVQEGSFTGHDYDQAAKLVDKLVEDVVANARQADQVYQTIATREDLITPIAQRVAKQSGHSVQDVVDTLSQSRIRVDAFPSAGSEQSLKELATKTRHRFNIDIVQRYGKPLPNTSPEELGNIEQHLKDQFSHDLQSAIPAKIEAVSFGPTQQEGEPPVHGYILNIGAERKHPLNGNPLNKDTAFHDLCATLMTRYPSYDLVMADAGHNSFFNERTLAAGRINLVPMDSGLLVMMPEPKAGERNSNLAVLEDYFQELVAQTKADKREAFKSPPIIARG